MKKYNSIGILALILTFASTTNLIASEMTDKNTELKNPGLPKTDLGKTGMMVSRVAKAAMKGTNQELEVEGEVLFIELPDGLKVMITLHNVPGAGKHGIHIHQNGSCADGGKAAGGHYNPHGVDHGLWEKDGPEHSHPGDMGNIIIDEKGSGTLTTILPGLTLNTGEYPVSGRAVILHAKEDDFGQPTGNAGARIGCGIITIIDQ